MKQAVFFLLFLLFTISGYAHEGCLSSNTTYTYINEESQYTRNSHYNNYNYSSSDRNGHVNRTFYHRYESDRNITASNFCTTPISPSTPCFIHATRSGYTSSPGTMVIYSEVDDCNLPIDDYIPFLFISLGISSIYFIRQKFLLA